jgi:hypothetical protein
MSTSRATATASVITASSQQATTEANAEEEQDLKSVSTA